MTGVVFVVAFVVDVVAICVACVVVVDVVIDVAFASSWLWAKSGKSRRKLVKPSQK